MVRVFYGGDRFPKTAIKGKTTIKTGTFFGSVGNIFTHDDAKRKLIPNRLIFPDPERIRAGPGCVQEPGR